MNYYKIVAIASLFLLTTGCVQKAYKKTVIVTLTLQNMKDVKTAGIRGNGKPLSWRQDYEMKELIKDSLYKATVTTITGYKFAEIKFTVNGEFELQNKDNRRVQFGTGDTSYYMAVFNQPPSPTNAQQ